MARYTRSQYENEVNEIETLLGQIHTISTLTEKINKLEIQRQTTIELAEKVLEDGLEGYASQLFDRVFQLQAQIYELANRADKQLCSVERQYNNADFAGVNRSLVIDSLHGKLSDELDIVANKVTETLFIEDYVR